MLSDRASVESFYAVRDLSLLRLVFEWRARRRGNLDDLVFGCPDMTVFGVGRLLSVTALPSRLRSFTIAAALVFAWN
jgi:hypothetical protein